jgi:hypothetical protein
MNTRFHHGITTCAVPTLSFALLAASLSHTAEAVDNTPDQGLITPSMRFAMQRDLGIMPWQADAYVAAERKAMQSETDARGLLGTDYAGSWLERDANGQPKLVIAAKRSVRATNARAAKIRAADADLRLVRYDMAQLKGVMTQLDRSRGMRALPGLTADKNRGKIDPSIYSLHIDPRSNSVVMTTAEGALEKGIDFVAASGVDVNAVRFETQPYAPRPMQSANIIRGGDRYWAAPYGCSIGLSVSVGAETGFVTAGHCAPAGTQVLGANRVPIGNFVHSVFPGYDYGWVRNSSGAWTAYPWVNTHNGSNAGVIGNLEVAVGGTICRSGATTGWRCGTIISRSHTVYYPLGTVYGQILSSACGGSGDSGGSVIGTGGEGQGVHSGGNIAPGKVDNCSEPDPRSFHQPLPMILAAYPEMIVQTMQTCGRMNPGQVLTAGGRITSCDGRYHLAMQTGGNLVLHRSGVRAIWSSGTSGSNMRAYLRPDGNLVILNSANHRVWASGSWGYPGGTLLVRDTGNMVILNTARYTVWQTNTTGL